MTTDEEVRRYERQLHSRGDDPREVGARLLSADPARYWLLVHPVKTHLPGLASRVPEPVTALYRVTLSDLQTEARLSLWAFRVITLEDFMEISGSFVALGQFPALWDRRTGVEIQPFGASIRRWSNYDRVEKGWHEPPALATHPTGGGGDVTVPTDAQP